MFEKVRDIIADELGIDPSTIQKDSNIIDDLDADSLDAVELIMAFEEAFDIEIDDESANGLVTVQTIIDYIQSKTK